MTVETSTHAEAPAAGRVSQRIVAKRRRKIVIGLCVVGLVTAIMIVLSLATRDLSDLWRCRAQLEYVREHLGAASAESPLPFVLPLPDDPRTALAGHYHYTPSNSAIPHATEGVAIVHCDKPHSMFVRASGRHVLLLEGSSYVIRWMTEAEFLKAAPTMGLVEAPGRP